MSISKMDLDLLASFIVGPTSFVLVLMLLVFVVKQFYANLHLSRARQKQQQSTTQEINLIPAHIPFVLELKACSNQQSTSENTGQISGKSLNGNCHRIPIEITTSVEHKTKVYVFWGINAKLFLDTLIYDQWSSGSSYGQPKQSSSSSSYCVDLPNWILKLKSFYGNLTTLTIDGSGTAVHQIDIPESVKEIRETMGSNMIIPCAIVIVPDEEEIEEYGGSGRQTDIKGLIVVAQLNSLTSRNQLEIKDRFIKTTAGFSFRLMPLFVQGESENLSSADTDDQELFRGKSSKEGPTSPDNQPFSRIRCALCQTLPISRAILPCGHVCTCGHCFTKLKYCPICRGNIQCFFKTRSEAYLNSIPNFMKSDTESKSRRLTWSEYFEEISDQLNLMLGLPEIN